MKTRTTQMAQKEYGVIGMTCEHCVHAVTSEVAAAPGVEQVAVDLAGGRITVTGDGFTDDAVRAAVDEAGYALVGA